MEFHLILHPLHCHQVQQWNRLVPLVPKFVALLADVVVSMLACAFVSRDYDGLPRVQGHTRDIARPCIDDNDLRRICYSHSAAPNISDSCIPQCASITASYRHSVVSRDTYCLRVDISQHAVAIINAVADVVVLVVDLILVVYCSDQWEQVGQWEGYRHRSRRIVVVFQIDFVAFPVAAVEQLVVVLMK